MLTPEEKHRRCCEMAEGAGLEFSTCRYERSAHYNHDNAEIVLSRELMRTWPWYRIRAYMRHEIYHSTHEYSRTKEACQETETAASMEEYKSMRGKQRIVQAQYWLNRMEVVIEEHAMEDVDEQGHLTALVRVFKHFGLTYLIPEDSRVWWTARSKQIDGLSFVEAPEPEGVGM